MAVEANYEKPLLAVSGIELDTGLGKDRLENSLILDGIQDLGLAWHQGQLAKTLLFGLAQCHQSVGLEHIDQILVFASAHRPDLVAATARNGVMVKDLYEKIESRWKDIN